MIDTNLVQAIAANCAATLQATQPAATAQVWVALISSVSGIICALIGWWARHHGQQVGEAAVKSAPIVALAFMLICFCGCAAVRVSTRSEGTNTVQHVSAFGFADFSQTLSKLSSSVTHASSQVSLDGLSQSGSTSNANQMILQLVPVAVKGAGL